MKRCVKYAVVGFTMLMAGAASATSICDPLTELAVTLQTARESGVDKAKLYAMAKSNMGSGRELAITYWLIDHIYSGGDPSEVYKLCVGSDKAV